jgi:hypothetical protein
MSGELLLLLTPPQPVSKGITTRNNDTTETLKCFTIDTSYLTAQNNAEPCESVEPAIMTNIPGQGCQEIVL